MKKSRFGYRLLSLLLVSLIFLSCAVPVNALYPTFDLFWPLTARFSEETPYYIIQSITCKEYSASGNIGLNATDGFTTGRTFFCIVEIPGLNAETASKKDYDLTLSVTHKFANDGGTETLQLKTDNYYYPVRLMLTSEDGRECPVYIVAIPAIRDYTQADFSVAAKLHYNLQFEVASLYDALSEKSVGVPGGYHKQSGEALSSYALSLGDFGLGITDYTIDYPSEERTQSELQDRNRLNPEQAAYVMSHTFPEVMEYCSQKIENAEIRSLSAAGVTGILSGNKEYTLTLPDGVDWTKIKTALAVEPIGACEISTSGSWASGRNVFINLSAKDLATGIIYDSSTNGIVQNTYILKLKTGDPAFGVSSFSLGGRTADITESESENQISLHLAKGWQWSQKPTISCTGTSYSFLDKDGNTVEPAADGTIDFTKAKTLRLSLDLSDYAVSGADTETLKFTKDYTLNITQGNSSACELLRFSVGAAEEEVVIDGTNITVTIPYATKWDSLKSSCTCSYDATVTKPTSEDFANSEKTPLKYTVTAENGTTKKEYSVTVKKIPAATDNKLVSFTYGSLSGKIDHDKGTVTLELPSGSSKKFAPVIELPKFTTVSPASGTEQDFTNPVTYTVTAQSGATKTYTVTVNVSTQAATNPRKAKMQSLLDSIIASYRSKAASGQSMDDWEYLNLGLYDLKKGKTEPNTDDKFDIASVISKRKLGPTDLITDLARVTLMLTARGYDCSNLAQYNDGQPFVDASGNKIDNLVENLCATSVSINGAQFALLALDIGNYTLPENTAHNRAYFLDYLLASDCKTVAGGLMGLDGVGSQMYAIGPYQDDAVYGARVKQWLQNGAQYIADQLTTDYTLKSWGSTNSEVISWSLMGLCAAGVDPYTDPRFGTSEKNMITQWLDTFSVSDGFKHVTSETASNAMATYEGCYALQWYLNFLENGGNGHPYHLWCKQHDFSKSLSTEAQILSFELEGKQAVIDHSSNTITLELPKGTPLTKVTPTLTLSDGAKLVMPEFPVTLADNVAQSFKVQAEDGKTSRVYQLTVTLKDGLQASGTELKTDSITLQDENQRSLEILKKTVTETEKGADILLNVDAGVNVKKLRVLADISYGATASPKLDGTSTIDLSNWKTFTITSQDGKTRTYRIKVEAKQIAEITSFKLTISGKTYTGVIDNEKNTITVSGVDDSKLTSTKLTPDIMLGGGATSYAPIGEQDFANEVSYTATGRDIVSRTYAVNVYNTSGARISAGGGSSSGGATTETTPKITEFKIYGVAGVINDAAGTIVVTLPNGTNVTKVTPQIKLPSGCTVYPANAQVVNLTRPISYTVTLGGKTKTYTVSVKYERSLSQQLWDEVADNNTVSSGGNHQVSYDPHPLTGKKS